MITAIVDFITRIRPGVTSRSGIDRTAHIIETFIGLYYTPLALLGIIWLAGLIGEQSWERRWPIYLAFTAVLFIIETRRIKIELTIDKENDLPMTLSLSYLWIWSGLLTLGSGVLWGVLAVSIYESLRLAYRQRSLKQEIFWGPFSNFSQLSIDILYSLTGLAIYQFGGGRVPFAGGDWSQWAVLLLAAIFAEVVMPQMILSPTYFFMTRLLKTGAELPLQAAYQLLTKSIALPFIALGPLLFVAGGVLYLFFFGAALVVVNLLAHNLSMINQRSRQQARELASLEALGEAILQAPPEGRGLRDLLDIHVRQMFPHEIVEIHLQATADIPLPIDAPFTVTHLPLGVDQKIPDNCWARLAAAAGSETVVEKVRLPGTTAPFGSAVLAPITLTDPNEPDAPPIPIGQVGLMRSGVRGRTEDSLFALLSLASQIGSAVYRARVHQETLAHQRTARDLEIAGQIQASFLPKSSPKIPGWQISGVILSARETSGDFFDFIDLGDGRWGFLVADVADKGTGAALYMALSRTLIRTFALQYPDRPALALEKANDRILADTVAEQFVTVFYAVLDPPSGRLVYTNAGHNPALLFSDRESLSYRSLPNTGIPLGMFENRRWGEETVDLAVDDILLLYTDGLTDALNEKGEEFGLERVIRAIGQAPARCAPAIRTMLLDNLQAFTSGDQLFDDVTLLVVSRLRPETENGYQAKDMTAEGQPGQA